MAKIEVNSAKTLCGAIYNPGKIYGDYLLIPQKYIIKC
jgi:hypothetical protein